MKIKTIKINQFGKLANKEINFGQNINIIYGKNEAGKSTILKFISSMFYGANKNKNGKEISDFEQYEPWNENEFSGKINYELDDGKKYEVYRDFRKKNPKIYNENSENISKEFSIDKNKGSEFFKEQTGIEEELFYSTAVAEQERVKLGEKEQNTLIQKMTNLVSSGNDTISYKRAMDKLKSKLMEEVGTERTTERPINKIEEKLTVLEAKYRELEKLAEKQDNFDERKRQIKPELDNNERYVNALKDIRKEKEDENLENEIIKISQDEIKNLEQKLENKKTEDEENLKTIKYYKNNDKNNDKNINKKNKEKNNTKNNFNKKIIPIIIFVLSIIFTMLLFIFNKIIIINYLFLLIPIINLIYLIIIKINENKINNKIKEEKIKQKKEQEILEENIKNKKIELENKINNLNKKIFEKELKIKNNYSGIYLDNIFSKNLNEIKLDLEKEEEINSELKLKLKEIEIEKKNTIPQIEKMPEIEEQIRALQEEKQELNSLANSIQIAKENIEEAYDEMKKSLTPQFTENLSNTINKISNGKYKNVKFSDEEGLIVELENGEYKKAERLSTGTIFQMYLSLRLAIAREITEEKMPIILDEVFAYYDDERLENILQYLAKEYADRQIVLFTCSQREKELLDKNDIEYNLIELK